MALETATYIGQLVNTNPVPGDPVAQGDDHLRLIKSVLQNSFPSLGNAAVTVTAAQLNAVTAKLTSFNGRTAVAAVPAEGDYTLTLLGDVAISAPALQNVLMYNGTNWQNIRGGACITAGDFLLDGYAGRVTDSVWFTNFRRNTVGASVATIKNDNAGGIGFQITAVAACLVQLNMNLNVSGVGTTLAISAGIGRFLNPAAPTAALPAAGNSRLAFATGDTPDTQDMWLTVSAAVSLAAGDDLCVYYQNVGTANPGSASLNGSIIAL